VTRSNTYDEINRFERRNRGGGAVIAGPWTSPATNPANDWLPTPCNSLQRQFNPAVQSPYVLGARRAAANLEGRRQLNIPKSGKFDFTEKMQLACFGHWIGAFAVAIPRQMLKGA